MKTKPKIKEQITKLVVDYTESEFFVSKSMDGAGTHYMLYMPKFAKVDFKTSSFFSAVRESIGKVRIILCFVPKGYIENFLNIR